MKHDDKTDTLSDLHAADTSPEQAEKWKDRVAAAIARYYKRKPLRNGCPQRKRRHPLCNAGNQKKERF